MTSVTSGSAANAAQVWEATMAASKFKADNLVAIVDQNGYQQTGATSEVLDLRPVAPKFEAFGWFAQEIDGHDMDAVLRALTKAATYKGKPSVIVSHGRRAAVTCDMDETTS